jgi:hypothetical protein
MFSQKIDDDYEKNIVKTDLLSENLHNDSDIDIENSETLAILNGPLNSKVYLVGTAHFSRESQNEVSKLIKKLKPNRVVLELCNSRINLLKLDEDAVLKEARDMNFSKMVQLIKQVFIYLFELNVIKLLE